MSQESTKGKGQNISSSADDLHSAWMKARQACEEIQRVYNDQLTRVDKALAIPSLEEAVPVLRKLQQNMNELLNILALDKESVGSKDSRTGLLGTKQSQGETPEISSIRRQEDFHATIVHLLNEIVEYLASSSRKLRDLLQLQILFFQKITPWMDAKIQALQTEQNHNLAYHIRELATPSVEKYDLHRLRVELEELKARIAGTTLETKTAAARLEPGQTSFPMTDDFRYFVFEELFRGPSTELKERLRHYLPLFADCPDPILDIGCGRGEFLSLVKETGKNAYGIELNEYDVQEVRKNHLEVRSEDVLVHLQSLSTNSLGGVFSAQVVEHLPPEKVYNMIHRLHHVMKPGGRIVLETVNPVSIYAFHNFYLKDPTHVFPVHPETLAFFVRYAGFQNVRTETLSPVPADQILPNPGPEIKDASVHEYLSALTSRINQVLFPSMEYYVTGVRL